MKIFLKISLCFILIVISAVSFTACSGNKPSGIPYADSRLGDFEKALAEKNLVYKEIVQRDHTLVGAKEAYAYVFDNTFVVEIYVYDKESSVYKEAVDVNMIPVLSMGSVIPVKFNGTMCIYLSDWQNEKADAIYDIFKNLK